jgi:hypothetical protein
MAAADLAAAANMGVANMDPRPIDGDRLMYILGAGVVDAWNELPKDIQELLFERAVAVGQGHDGRRQQLALFLHQHNKRTAAASK